MNIKYLKDFVNESISKYPNLQEDIIDIYQLAIDEIDEGGSEYNECNLAINFIKEVIEDNG